jgi:hypothetical protein
VPRVHAAIIDARLASGLRDGRKRLETRFGHQRRLPYGRISVGDQVYFKISGSDIIGHSTVNRVLQFDNLNPRTIDALQREYNYAILAPAEYWREHRNCRFGVLIWLGRFSSRGRPPSVPRQYGAGWVLLAP